MRHYAVVGSDTAVISLLVLLYQLQFPEILLLSEMVHKCFLYGDRAQVVSRDLLLEA